ncbi:2-nitropropane dioxygenase [Mycolicibacterium novocastrense]|uniref:NAD(P)H-dependent flavin oxidoreductase n=1 Tax=Mycolicibacterium novocastrense TaxID=59813 RepID=UPI000745F78F|nr:nitronate monooxygenase [Mycolicibacterium novocastrense]KUH73690.1 2-nitropropane dioxygenase [Mycolicibacterium novocastrense]KUH74781.1 2-nitropropane dioxygenase [Mycolicibacterium novocastrense]KUH76096.1 2-nitropropane dioxygenase [Mycolicibacterium novocastrense]
MPLATPWSRRIGLEVPIVNAPMGGTAGGVLAAAVSRAGGLGMVGMGSSATAAKLATELPHVSGLGRPFGIGLVHWVTAAEPELLEVALAAKPALLAVSFGDEWSWVQRAHDAGVSVAAQVADVTGARRAADAGVDVIVARGAEGGGHGEARIGTLPLLAEVLDAVTVPVLAAGGIGTGRGLAAVLAAGASGAWLGTAFITCTEATTSDGAREQLLRASGEDTVTTRVFDIALDYPWPTTFPERVLRNQFVDRFDGREDLIDADARAVLAAAAAAEDYSVAPVNAGQGVGMVRETRSAADVVERLCTEAEQLLRRWG